MSDIQAGWVPSAGMALDHKTIKQTVYVIELRQTPAGPFWAINDSRYGPVRPWLIREDNLVAQYTPAIK